MGKLVKSSYDKKIAGVCGGIARFFGLDTTLVRVVFALSTIFSLGTTVLVYLVLMFVMPKD